MKKIITVLILTMVVFMLGCTGAKSKLEIAPVQVKKVLLVIPPVDFADDELFKPKAELEKNGIKVVVAGIDKKVITGMDGGKATPDIELSGVNIKDYDMIAVIGGYGTINHLWDNIALKSIIIDAENEGKYIGSICAATVVLAKAGVIKGKKVTGFPDKSITDEIEKNGAIYTGNVTEVDGKIVTGKNPDAAQAFGEKMVEILK